MTRVIAASVVCVLLGACYILQPTLGNTMPPLGSRIAVDLNDAGRSALGGLMGPEIAQIEGRLISGEGMDTGTEYDLAVTAVHLLRGGEQVWSGERVKVRREFITRVYDRQLSKGRTVVASAVGAGLVTYFATRAIAGYLQGDRGITPPDSAHSIRRPIRP